MSNSSHKISVLNEQIALPQFAFFQLVKVKMTGEVAVIIGMRYCSSNKQDDAQNEEWLYLLQGLTRFSSTWWAFDQLHNFDRR